MFNGFTGGVPTYSYNNYQTSFRQQDNTPQTNELPIGPQTKLQSDLYNSLLAALYSNIPFVLTALTNSLGYPGIMGGQFMTADNPVPVVEAKDSSYTTDFKTVETGYPFSGSPQYLQTSNQVYD